MNYGAYDGVTAPVGSAADSSSEMRERVEGPDVLASEAESVSRDAVGATGNGAGHTTVWYRRGGENGDGIGLPKAHGSPAVRRQSVAEAVGTLVAGGDPSYCDGDPSERTGKGGYAG